jgi:hypothetical protein
MFSTYPRFAKWVSNIMMTCKKSITQNRCIKDRESMEDHQHYPPPKINQELLPIRTITAIISLLSTLFLSFSLQTPTLGMSCTIYATFNKDCVFTSTTLKLTWFIRSCFSSFNGFTFSHMPATIASLCCLLAFSPYFFLHTLVSPSDVLTAWLTWRRSMEDSQRYPPKSSSRADSNPHNHNDNLFWISFWDPHFKLPLSLCP